MSSIVRLDRRAFMRNAGATAIASATGVLVSGTSSAAAQSSSSIPRLPNGRFDLGAALLHRELSRSFIRVYTNGHPIVGAL